MAKKTIGDKAERVLKLLLGLRDRRVASALASRGFTKADLDEGFTLLRGLTDVSLGTIPSQSANPALIAELDEWENEWFPVADASLRRHFPAVHSKLFLNLSQTEGAPVVISVGTFVDRLAEMNRAGAEYGDEGKEARKLLRRRGLTAEVVDKAEKLLAQLTTIEKGTTPPDLEEHRARVAAAEDSLWAWYREWGTLARGAIQDRRLLRQLGFLALKRGSSGDEALNAEDDISPADDAATDDDAPSTAD